MPMAGAAPHRQAGDRIHRRRNVINAQVFKAVGQLTLIEQPQFACFPTYGGRRAQSAVTSRSKHQGLSQGADHCAARLRDAAPAGEHAILVGPRLRTPRAGARSSSNRSATAAAICGEP